VCHVTEETAQWIVIWSLELVVCHVTEETAQCIVIWSLELVVCHVTEETAQSVVITATIIIIIIIITNTIGTTIQSSARCKWQMFLARSASIHVREQDCWGKSTNMDSLTNCRAGMGDMVKLNKTERRRLWNDLLFIFHQTCI
jgi:hypothetical protein